MIPRLGDGNDKAYLILDVVDYGLENDSPSRGRKHDYALGYR